MASYPNVVTLSALNTADPAASEDAAKLADSVRQLKYFLVQYLAKTHDDAGDVKALYIIGSMIADGTVGADQIAAGAITHTKLGTGVVEADNLAAGAVTVANILDRTITAVKIALDQITEAEISETAGIKGTQLAADTLTSVQIGPNAITASELANDAVTTDKILNDAVTLVKIGATAAEAPTVPALLAVTASGVTEALSLAGNVVATLSGATPNKVLNLNMGGTAVTSLVEGTMCYFNCTTSGTTTGVAAVAAPSAWVNVRTWQTKTGGDTSWITQPTTTTVWVKAGTYRVTWYATSTATDVFTTCLCSVGGVTVYASGSVDLAPAAAGTTLRSTFDGYVTFAADTTMEMRQYNLTSSPANVGFGNSVGASYVSGVTPVYAQLMFIRIV